MKLSKIPSTTLAPYSIPISPTSLMKSRGIEPMRFPGLCTVAVMLDLATETGVRAASCSARAIRCLNASTGNTRTPSL